MSESSESDEYTEYEQSPLYDETMPPYEDWATLYAAVKRRDIDSVKSYLDAGWNVNQIYHPTTPLIEAIRNKDVEMVSFLLSRGADPNMCAYGYSTPLCSAIPSLAICKMLLEKGADPNKQGDYYIAETPMIQAVWWQAPEIFALLLLYGGDPNRKNEMQESPLDIAEKLGNSLFKSIAQNASAQEQ